MKWMKWMLKLAVSAAITSFCCVAMTFFAVNAYVDLLLDQYHIERPANQKIDWNQFVGRFTAQFGVIAASPANKGAERPRDVAVSANAGGSSAPTSTSETGTKERKDGMVPQAPGGKETNEERRPPEDAVAVWSRQSAAQGSASDEQRKIVVSAEEFTKKKKQLSEADKAKVFSIVSTRVPQEKMQTISQLLEDGITAAELKELEQLLQQYLKPEEYKELQNLIRVP